MNSFKINNIEYIIDNTIDNNSFVGIKIVNGIYHLCFPIGFKVKEGNEKYYKEILRYLYKTVMLTKTLDIDKDSDNNILDEKTIPLNSYLYIISDYFNNGLYKYSETKYRRDVNGKINWKRTFNNGFYLQDNTPIYLNTVIKYNKKEKNIISLLQMYAVNKSIDMLVFHGNYSKVQSELTDKDINKNITYYNNVLDKELRSTNNDKKKLLLTNIKNVINDCSNIDNSIRTYGTYSYEYSFEKMIDKLFGNIDVLSEYYPSALWYLDVNKKEFESSKLREDTIYKGKDKIYIIDSKYYKYGILNDNSFLPNTSAIYKQIVYGDYVYSKLLNEEGKEYEIYNVFVIPSDKDEFLEYQGYAKMKLLDSDKEFKKVYLVFINMNEVINKYFNKEFNQIDKMMDIIENKKHI